MVSFEGCRAETQEPWTFAMIGALLGVLALLTISYVQNVRRGKTIANQAATLAAIYDSIPAMVFTKDLNGQYTSYNSEFAEDLQITESQVIGKFVQELLVLEDDAKDEFSEATRKAISEKITVKTEGWYNYSHGKRRAKEIIRTPLIQGGKVVGLLGIVLDITERKLVEETAKKTHERASIMLDTIPHACCLINRSHECIDCNNTAVEISGLKSKQEFTRRFNDLVPKYQPDGRGSRETLAAYVDTAFKEGTCTFEWTFQLADGTPRPSRNTLVRSHYEKVPVVLLYSQDLREQKRLATRIEVMIDNLPGVVFQQFYDPPDFTYTFVSKGCEALTGYTAEELQGKPAIYLVHPDDVSIIKEQVAASLPLNLPLEAIARILAKDGEEKWVWIRSRVIEHHPDGTPSLLEGYFTDISERWKLEVAETENRLKSATIEYTNKLNRALAQITTSPTIPAGVLKDAADVVVREGCLALNVSRIGIWSVPPELDVLKSISCYDISKDEAGYTIQDYFDFRPFASLGPYFETNRLLVTKNVKTSEWWADVVDGYNPDMCASLGVPVWNDGKLTAIVRVEQDRCEAFPEEREWTVEEQNFTASLADMMALTIAGAERREARDAAETASRAKSAFLAMMSHEIRTPMNVICGVTEVLQQNESLSENVTESLDRIRSASDLLLGIINDILDFSKIEAGRLDITPVEYKIASVINDAVNLNLIRTGNKPIEFELQIDENIPAKLIGDELRIKQILNNVLSNAFKYTDTGTVTLSVAFEPGEDGITLVFGVRDTGYGMSEEQISQLFGEYFRFKPETSRIIEGTGLGLAITHRLVCLMNGNIQVESKPGKGSLFTVRLPQGTVDDEVLGKELAVNLQQFQSNYRSISKRSQIVRDPMPYGKVLIVDDMETNVYVAVKLMQPYGLQIDTAMSGAEAVDKIKVGNVYDIIFMDHMMPKMNGIETTKRLRELGYTNPVVVLTANAVAGQAGMFLQSGFDSFIAKPIDTRQLNLVLNQLVRDKQPPEVVEAARRQRGNVEEDDTVSSQINPLLMESFIRDAYRSLAVLESVCQNGQLDTEEGLQSFTITIHGIKGSLGNIGESELAESAFQLESAAREQNTDLITASTPSFMAELRVLLEDLESKREADGTDENIVDLLGKLRTVQKMCENDNRKGALELLSNVTDCSAETQELLDSIQTHILQGELEEAANTAASYANVLAVVLDEQ